MFMSPSGSLSMFRPKQASCVALASSLASAQPVFVDDTAGAGIGGTYAPPPGAEIIPMLAGAAAADFDRDGDVDLFILMGGTSPDRLYLNDGDGTFTDHATAWGVDARHVGGGCCAGDVDGNGFIDLFVASHAPESGVAGPGHHRLYLNDGTGFTEAADAWGVRTASPTHGDGFGCCFGDMDLDGDLDLFVTGWVGDAAGNRLFRNEGDHFTDVTDTAIDDPDFAELRGFAPRFADMDGDLWPELLVAADYFTSRYYRNDHGTFVNLSPANGTGFDSNGMGATIADFDADGRLDWYVTSIFFDGAPPLTNGNMLYLAQGDHQYVEVGLASGVKNGGWGWGTIAADLDHDGDLDLAEVNGWGSGQWVDEQAYLFLNHGDATFTEAALSSGFVSTNAGRGLLNLDADGDGDQDLFVCNLGDPVQFFRNDLAGPDTNWIRVAFDTSEDPGLAPDGFGTRLVAIADGVERLRLLDGGSNFLATSEPVIHVGLAGATAVDLEVTWANGKVTLHPGVDVNQSITLACPCPGDWNGDDLSDIFDLLVFLDRFASGETAGDLTRDGVHDIFDVIRFLALLDEGC